MKLQSLKTSKDAKFIKYTYTINENIFRTCVFFIKKEEKKINE